MLEIDLDRHACTTSMLKAYTIQTTKLALVAHTCTTYVTHVICKIDQHLQTSHVGRHEMKVQIKNPTKENLRTSSSTVFGPPSCAITQLHVHVEEFYGCHR
jgi:hypothetical protein